MSLRIEAFEVPPQDLVTRDNVTVKVNAVVYFRVVDPMRAVIRGYEFSLCHKPAFSDDAAQRVG